MFRNTFASYISAFIILVDASSVLLERAFNLSETPFSSEEAIRQLIKEIKHEVGHCVISLITNSVNKFRLEHGYAFVTLGKHACNKIF